MNRLLFVALLVGVALPAAAAPIAITGATAMTGMGEQVLENATIIINNGLITAIGTGLAVPPGATVVDAKGRTVTPGIIALGTDLGLTEVGGVGETNDAGARQSPYGAALDMATAINPYSMHIAIARAAGVTRAAVVPEASNSVFAGQGVLISLADAGFNTVMQRRAFQMVELGETGARLAGGSRPAAWAQLLGALAQAQRLAYGQPLDSKGDSTTSLAKRADVEALVPVVQGRQPLLVHVERASDINEVLNLQRQYRSLKLVLVGAREGWLLPALIGRALVPVVTHSLYDLPDSFESLAASRNNAGILRANGVTVALGTLGGIGGTIAGNLPSYAGNLAAQALVPGGKGMSRAAALATITAAPARILGLDDLGTLEVGKRADVVMWDGDPLELASAPVAVWIDGAPQPLANRQLQLRDRYKDLSRSDLPLQYPR